MHNHTVKTKTAMLLELESIKGLLVEEDDIPILQEVVVQDIPVLDVPVLNEIVPSEELPEEAIPLLVSVVADENIVDKNAINKIAANSERSTEQPLVLQTPFAIHEEVLSWSQCDLGAELSLNIEMSTEPELETDIAYRDNSVAHTASASTSASTSEISSLLPLGEIPTLLEIAAIADTTSFIEKITEEKTEAAFDEAGKEADEKTGEKTSEETSYEIDEAINNKTDEEIDEVNAISAQPEIPQRRAEQQQDFFQIAEEPPEPNGEPLSEPVLTRPASVKSAGENPFLPEHIRARLQGRNNPNSDNTGEYTIHSKRFKALSLGSLHSTTNKPAPIQQQLINDVMDKMLPEMAKELRGRLEQMSKKMLEELLAEYK